jgi:hypothetical protein
MGSKWKEHLQLAARSYAEEFPDHAFMIAVLETNSVPFFLEVNPDEYKEFENENGC